MIHGFISNWARHPRAEMSFQSKMVTHERKLSAEKEENPISHIVPEAYETMRAREAT